MTSDNSDSNDLEKLNLWKKTYALFSKYSTFEGPFYTEGYLDKKIGVQIYRHGNKFIDIDILAVNKCGSWVGLELTTNPRAFKDDKLAKFSLLRPDEIMHKTALHITDDNEIMLFDTTEIKSEYPQITFDNESVVHTHNISKVKNESLKTKLLHLNGSRIPISPSISFTMAPESSPFEVRTAIIPIILQILTDKIESISAEKIVEICLSTIFEEISLEDKKGLVKTTRSCMFDLITNYLPNYLQIKDDNYLKGEKSIKMSVASLETIHNQIDLWLHSKKSTQTFLDGYTKSDS